MLGTSCISAARRRADSALTSSAREMGGSAIGAWSARSCGAEASDLGTGASAHAENVISRITEIAMRIGRLTLEPGDGSLLDVVRLRVLHALTCIHVAG